MRLVFISSVTAIRPLRTISVVTGSMRPRRLLARLLLLRMVRMVRMARMVGMVRIASARSRDRDQQISERIDRHYIPRHQHRRGGMLLDQRRPFDLVAGQQV